MIHTSEDIYKTLWKIVTTDKYSPQLYVKAKSIIWKEGDSIVRADGVDVIFSPDSIVEVISVNNTNE